MKIFTSICLFMASVSLFAQLTVKSSDSFYFQGNDGGNYTYTHEVFRNQFNTDGTINNYYKAPAFIFTPGQSLNLNDITKVELKVIMKDIKTGFTGDYKFKFADLTSVWKNKTGTYPVSADFNSLNLDLVNNTGSEFFLASATANDDAVTWDVTDILKTALGEAGATGSVAIVLAPMRAENGYHEEDNQNRLFYGNRADAIDFLGDGTDIRDFRPELIISGVSTAIANLESNQLAIVPNPASSMVTIKGVEPGTEINIMNVAGGIVKKVIAHSDLETIEVNDLSKGLYLVLAGKACQKLVVR